MTSMRVGLGRAVALTSMGLLATGCAMVVGGTAEPAPRSAPRALPGATIKTVLLGNTELSAIVKQSLTIDPRFPPRFGGPEALQPDEASSSPVDCLSVATILQQSAYRSTKVKDVAVETWRHATRSSEVTSVKEGVVSLPTAADAEALFARFSDQWRKCDGTTLPLPDRLIRLKARVSNVQGDGSALGATVAMGFASLNMDSDSIPAGRAIGVRGNCLVEVEVDFFNASARSPHPSGAINATALTIAQRMMDRVSALS